MRRLIQFSAFALCVFLSSVVLASHYDLEDASFIAAEDKAKLLKAGVPDTEALLNAGLTPEARTALATRSGVARASLDLYVFHCDLLRITGIGPDMAVLLHLVGVESLKALAQATPDPLRQKLTEANDAKHILGVIPQPETLRTWIERASALPVIVQ